MTSQQNASPQPQGADDERICRPARAALAFGDFVIDCKHPLKAVFLNRFISPKVMCIFEVVGTRSVHKVTYGRYPTGRRRNRSWPEALKREIVAAS